MNCIQKQQLVSFPKVRIWKPWFRHFNNHKEFRNEGTVHLFSLMALFSYANFRSNERNYDAALGKRRIRDYDNIETKRYLDVIESMLLTNDSGLLCTVLQATRMSDRDSAEFYLMRPETLSSWAKNHIKTTTKTCSE